MTCCGNKLNNKERIKSKKQLEMLFGGGKSRSMVAFPVRLVYMTNDCTTDTPQLMMMVSVSKRHFKHAVKRNRVERTSSMCCFPNTLSMIRKIHSGMGVTVSSWIPDI